MNQALEAVIWLWEAFALCCLFQIIMFGRRKLSRLLIFSLKEDFDILFVYVMNTRDDLLCPPGIMENSVNCHGKVMELYYQISVGTLLTAMYSLLDQVQVVARSTHPRTEEGGEAEGEGGGEDGGEEETG